MKLTKLFSIVSSILMGFMASSSHGQVGQESFSYAQDGRQIKLKKQERIIKVERIIKIVSFDQLKNLCRDRPASVTYYSDGYRTFKPVERLVSVSPYACTIESPGVFYEYRAQENIQKNIQTHSKITYMIRQ